MVTRLATLADLEDEGIPLAAFGNIQPSMIQRILDRTSSYVLGFVGDKIQTPLVPPYDPALVQATVDIAVWRLMKRRGYRPDNSGDAVIVTAWKAAEAWLIRIANGQVKLDQQGSFPESLQPSVSSNQTRGIGDLGDGSTLGPTISGAGNWSG